MPRLQKPHRWAGDRWCEIEAVSRGSAKFRYVPRLILCPRLCPGALRASKKGYGATRNPLERMVLPRGLEPRTY